MAAINFDYHPRFFTATILEWKHLLKNDAYKDIVINSLRFLKEEKSIIIYGYVIMPNHIHLIWQIQDGFTREKIQMRFLKFTAQQMKFKLQKEDPLALEQYRVNAKDREYQFLGAKPVKCWFVDRSSVWSKAGLHSQQSYPTEMGISWIPGRLQVFIRQVLFNLYEMLFETIDDTAYLEAG
jgi:REP element-mobilizing transposase RayT